jgi:hypothetical protein
MGVVSCDVTATLAPGADGGNGFENMDVIDSRQRFAIACGFSSGLCTSA